MRYCWIAAFVVAMLMDTIGHADVQPDHDPAQAGIHHDYRDDATPTAGDCQWPALPTLMAEPIASVNAPVYITHAPGDAQRIFIVDRSGLILIVDDGQLLETPFLDLTDEVTVVGETGLLGMAFHPQYEVNGRVFLNVVTYTDGSPIFNSLYRYTVSSTQPNKLDHASAQLVMQFNTGSIHVGGWIGFGTDGYLYLSTGDRGSPSIAQNPLQLPGSILRIDVDSEDQPYAIPPDNPFVGVDGRDEIWAMGLRNPFRCAFDRATGDLWIGDVGSDGPQRFEEVNFQPAGIGGVNYGWPCMEGHACFQSGDCVCPNPSLTQPIHGYTGLQGCSIIGGEVYRGSAIPQLNGAYLFGDFCTKKVWALRRNEPCPIQVRDLSDDLTGIGHIVGFGTDLHGEVYIGTYGGVYKIVPQPWLGDLNADGVIDSTDLLILLSAWGPCSDPTDCPADSNADGVVDVADLLNLLTNWG